MLFVVLSWQGDMQSIKIISVLIGKYQLNMTTDGGTSQKNVFLKFSSLALQLQQAYLGLVLSCNKIALLCPYCLDIDNLNCYARFLVVSNPHMIPDIPLFFGRSRIFNLYVFKIIFKTMLT